MATYTISVGTVASEPQVVGDILSSVGSHFATWGYSISSVAIGTGQNAGKLQITTSATLTKTEMDHLGLV